ncbi:MAG: hypothetical protein RSE15_00715 [Flavobacterium sp.]|uniref:hypothetical protein n=1 Tax=Flavobacterium sp. TaxID=239 RepID=UPI002B493BFB|nr:hypothetical protein [Flavobacterium sp.]WRH73369.1 MAG: hypothetical protein RSE15_00715 [Flavobacterium sp.]
MKNDNTEDKALNKTDVITGALIPMTDYVLKQYDYLTCDEASPNFVKKVVNYSYFLKQPLKLEMFFPFDEEGNPLEIPLEIYYQPNFGCQKYPQECYKHDLKIFNEAMEKVLFKGFIIESGYIQANRDTLYLNNQDGLDIASKNESHDKNFICDGFTTIEDLIPYNIQLTDVAIKHIFG